MRFLKNGFTVIVSWIMAVSLLVGCSGGVSTSTVEKKDTTGVVKVAGEIPATVPATVPVTVPVTVPDTFPETGKIPSKAKDLIDRYSITLTGDLGYDAEIEAITWKPEGDTIDYIIRHIYDPETSDSWDTFVDAVKEASIDVSKNDTGYSYAVLDSLGDYAVIAYKGTVIYDVTKGGVQD